MPLRNAKCQMPNPREWIATATQRLRVIPHSGRISKTRPVQH